MSTSYPTRSEVEYHNNNTNEEYPNFSDINNNSIIIKYSKSGVTPNNQNHPQHYNKPIENKNYPQQPPKPQKPEISQQQGAAAPIIQPLPMYMNQMGQQYAPVPNTPPQNISFGVPHYAMPYYPGQPMYHYPLNYPYYGPPSMGPNTILVIPPGYQRDYSGGYSPWGDLADDLDNLF